MKRVAMAVVLGVALLAILAYGCAGKNDCNEGDSPCSANPGAYLECSSGEGFSSYSESRCPGIEPVCVATSSTRHSCEDHGTAAACKGAIQSNVNVPMSARLTMVRDIDQDGALDLVGGTADATFVIHGDGKGSFSAVTPIDANTSGTRSGVIAGDFDGDGKVDLVLGTYEPAQLFFLGGDGTGQFTQGQRYVLDLAPNLTQAADLDGDGQDELLGGAADGVHIYSGVGGDQFSERVISTALAYGGSEGVSEVRAANFDGKLGLDFIERDYDAMLNVFLAEADGGFRRQSAPSGSLENWVLGDLNGDGLTDMVSGVVGSKNEHELAVWLAHSDGISTRAGSYGQAFGSAFVTVGDVDGDGKTDVVSVHEGGNVSVFLGKGDGTLRPAQIFKSNGTDLQSPLAGDFNGDGRLDLLNFESTGRIVVLPSACFDN